MYYTYGDYQGNLLAVTDASGNVKERYAYDPWGLRKNPSDWSQLDNRKSFLFSRGYTLHEHLDGFWLINMNGRVYDPIMAQFLSPDPFIQAPGNWYNYNRYGYCLNNPLVYVDPDGEIAWLVPALVFIGKAALTGAAINAGFYAVTTAPTGRQWDWGQFGKSAAIGAIAGVASAGAGALTTEIMPSVYGAVPGALIKGGIQGVAGGVSGGFGNVIMEGGWGEKGSNFWKGAGQGFATGFIMGGISGGFEGYKNAQSVGANPWSGKLYSNQTTYLTTTKSGIPLQPDPNKHCYAYSNAYADAGHGNRSAADFIRAAGYADGADAGQVFRSVDPANFNWSQRISGAQWDNVGGSLQMGREILGTTSRGGVNHWVNFTRITTSDKWRIIGGGWKRVLYSTSVWDPISGHVVNGPTNFFSIVSLF